jgi:protein SCO1/2
MISSPARPRAAFLAAILATAVCWTGGAAGAAPPSSPTSTASTTSPAGAPGAAPAVAVSGALHIPDVTLLDQDGRPVRFWSDVVRGRVVAVSFVFTTCTTICPPLGANFARLRSLLGSRAGSAVELISVSIDPENDTPARLKAWAAKFGAGPGWTLLTGVPADVERLLRGLQVYTPNFRDHSPLILVGNAATGNWQRISGLAPATEIAAQLARLGGGASR